MNCAAKRDQLLSDVLSEGSEKQLNFKREIVGDKGIGGSRPGTFDQVGTFHMASKSPARSTVGDDIGVNPPLGESALTEFDGGLPKSPLRDRFLNDIGSVPNARARSRDVTRSPIRERGSGDFDYDGVGKSPGRQRNIIRSPVRVNEIPGRPTIEDDVGAKSPTRESDLIEVDGGFPKSPMRDRFLSDLSSVPSSPMRSTNVSKSPMRERVQVDFNHDGLGKSPIRESRIPMSVRSRHVSRSPMREGRNAAGLDGVDKSPARSMAGDFPKSPRGRLASEFQENAEVEHEEEGVGITDVDEEARGRKLTVKSSFSSWLTDSEHTGRSDDNYSGRRRTWRDQAGAGVDQISDAGKSVHEYDHGMASEGSVGDHVQATDPRRKSLYRDRFKGEDGGGYAALRATIDQSAARRDGAGVIHGNLKAVVEHGRMSATSSRTAEQASNYRPNSIGSYSDPRQSFETLRGPASLQDLEMERAELFRRYKELSEQLGNLDEKRISSTGLYGGPDDYSDSEFGRFRARSRQQFVPVRGVQRPIYANHFPNSIHNMEDVYDMHPPLYDNPFSGQMSRVSHPKQAHQFSKYIPGSVGGWFDQDSPKSYLDEMNYHHPSCSCSLCYTDDWQSQDLPYSLAGRRSGNLLGNPQSSHSMNLDRNNQRAYNSRMAHSTPLERPSHHLAHRHPRRSQLANLNKQFCLPIAGGAPFILCQGCFRLLKFRKKFMVRQKNQYQLKCGACSAVFSFDTQSKSFSLLSAQKNQDFIEADGGPVKGLKESSLDDHHDSCDATSTNVGSCDFDAVGNSFQSMDSEASELSKAQRLSASLVDNVRNLSPSSSCSSKEDWVSDNASARSSLPNSTEMPKKINLVPPPPGSPLRDLLDYSSRFRKIQAGDVTNYTGEEIQEIERDASLENPVENLTVATEMEVHSHEGPPTSFSQDEDLPRKEDDIKDNEDRESSITGAISPGRAEVYVNGQHIPQHLVKKAEKFAGRIEPGEYWYDSKAGFWGVMGHRCLGIIPPFIQEFCFPVPANCSGGDTTIYVNGRQLNKKDLDILAVRGLPSMRNKKYIVDISGKVLDEATKKSVVNLGKLAPTVERKRRGFGMQVPEDLDKE